MAEMATPSVRRLIDVFEAMAARNANREVPLPSTRPRRARSSPLDDEPVVVEAEIEKDSAIQNVEHCHGDAEPVLARERSHSEPTTCSWSSSTFAV